jgi:pyruvate/2-oxoglutarate dehydrogenase complex dihydrolipoamide dehydrogenase (E3) component
MEKLSLSREAPRGINLHPADHLPKEVDKKAFDVVVIGSGPVGRMLAMKTAGSGLSTVIVEEELFGGDCPFWACVPSKALLRPAETLAASRTVTGAAKLIAKESTVDIEGVFQRRDMFTQKWDDKFLVDISLSQGCAIVRGHGILAGEKQVFVKNVNGDEVLITANYAVALATGSDPILPGIDGLQSVPYWTPRDAISSDKFPGSLIIVGAGAVGSEMASAYAGFGSKVLLICTMDEILPRVNRKAGQMVREALQRAGVEIHLSVRVTHVKQTAAARIEARLSDGKILTGDAILIAAGRKPRVSGLGLERIGIKLPLAIDDDLVVSDAQGKTDWLYAVGDATGIAFMTHMGSYQARMAANTIVAKAKGAEVNYEAWSKFSHTADCRAVSQVIFTDPNVAFVGLSVDAAREKGLNIKVVELPFAFPGAWLHAEFNYEGWAQWVIDADKHLLVGATFVGREAADLLHASTIAIVGEVTLDRLRHAVAPFPTVSEIYTALLMAAE